ncbi:hypothetical protein [Streptomyces sp. NPDC004134]
MIESLGGAAGDLAPAERDRLVRIDSRITFRHPRVGGRELSLFSSGEGR